MSEANLMRALQVAAREHGCWLFRNQVGGGWSASSSARRGESIVLSGARYVRYGLCEGSSDLIGWSSTGRFVAIEVKLPGKGGGATKLQLGFIEQVKAAGGVAGIVTSTEELEELLCHQS